MSLTPQIKRYVDARIRDVGVVQVGGGSGSGTVPWQSEMVEVVLTALPESGNAIEVTGASFDITGVSLASAEIGVMLIVSDSAGDTEPSATATIDVATSPVGHLIAGGGTATAVFRTDSSGNFRIKVSETASASRYLWVRAGGHFQRYVKSRDGVLELPFT